MNGKDITKKVGRPKKTLTTTQKAKPYGKSKTSADLEATLQDKLGRLEDSNHDLRVSLFKAGVSYGRMLASKYEMFRLLAFFGAVLLSTFFQECGLHSFLQIILVFLLFAFCFFSGQFEKKEAEKEIAKETEGLEKLHADQKKAIKENN